MRAVVQERYGSSDTWQLTETDCPEIETNEVLVRVQTAGLDRGTWHTTTGRPYLMSVMGSASAHRRTACPDWRWPGPWLPSEPA